MIETGPLMARSLSFGMRLIGRNHLLVPLPGGFRRWLKGAAMAMSASGISLDIDGMIVYLKCGQDGSREHDRSLMRNAIALSILALLMGLMAGCATHRQVQELSLQVEAMREDQTAIRAENARLDSLFRSNLDQSKRLNADFAAYADQLDQRLQIIEARLEDAITLINRTGGAPIPAAGQTGTAPSDTAQSDTTQTKQGLDCKKIYNAAYYDFVKGQYDMAISGFKNYLSSCPGTGLNDNAQYWIGECYYVGKDYLKAQKAFEDMIARYPSSERLAAAKLKLGETLYALREKTKARQYFEDVIKNNPGTNEAQEAAQMLERYR